MRAALHTLLAELHFAGMRETLDTALDAAEQAGDPPAAVLLRQALVNGYRGRFYNAQDLIDELYASLADHSTTRLLKRLAAYDVLVVDELGYMNLKPEHANALFQLLEQRYARKSTLITTNLDFDQWYALFRNPPLVDALLDRLRHHCITLRLAGPSLRAPAASPENSAPR